MCINEIIALSGDVDLLLPDFDEPTRELFIWSVLLNRQEMSSLFWDEGKVRLVISLIYFEVPRELAL